jgi:CRISPR system Cascade subunit CasD
MAPLLLRCAGPMQSWGTDSSFTVRETGLEPSKSGVIGLVCSALGRPRSDNITDLAALRMGVRVDVPGVVKVDFQTARNVVRADGKPGGSVTSNRYFLTDADFLVGLEGESPFLAEISRALSNPVWSLYLGRKGYVPSVPVWIPDGLVNEGLEKALLSYPWPGLLTRLPAKGERPESLRLVLESGEGEIRNDQPVSFDKRLFATRMVTTKFVPLNAIHLRGDE